jgi:hypothetical protein
MCCWRLSVYVLPQVDKVIARAEFEFSVEDGEYRDHYEHCQVSRSKAQVLPHGRARVYLALPHGERMAVHEQ